MSVKFGYIKSKLGTVLGVTPFYPIGYIIEETSGINPEKWYGGIWELYGKGCITACINNEDNDTNSKTNFNKSVGTVIGSKYLQSHYHSVRHKGGSEWQVSDAFAEQKTITYSPNSGYGTDSQPSGTGDSQNIQPTILIYRWRKIAY